MIIPVLSISISYILTEAFNRKSGLGKSPGEARFFYIIIAIAMSFGISMQWLGISPVKALLFTTILYGIITPFLIGIILLVSNNKKVMGNFRNNRISNITGMSTLLLMLANLIVLGYYLFIK